MGLGGEVHDRVDAARLIEHLVHALALADAALEERVARVVRDVAKVVEVTRVGELVVADDLPVGVLREHPTNEVRADEPGSTANEEPHPFFTLQS